MPDDYSRLIYLGIVGLVLLWIVFRVRNSVKRIVKNEIFDNLPSIKNTIDNLEHRIGHLNTLVESLERRLKELEDNANKQQ